ncbi:uncharacterized protein LOC135835575 [Planococcus citri]|uniref:uncharacterized protein LOC135835575 n=1 Tax=Planococcus citri TaxID=170843 RepID=UPI0031F8AD3B
MLLRVVLCTCIVYQAVNANESKLKDYEGNPSVDYFWTTVRQTFLRFIDSWNLDDPANVVSRETLQEIWYPLERSFKDKIGSRSWMRISNHFKDTMTHPQAADTLEKLFSCIHRLLLRNASKEVKDLYRGLDQKEKAWNNLFKLKVLFINEIFKIQEDPQMRKSFGAIKNFVIGRIRKHLNEESSEDLVKESEGDDKHPEKSSKHEKHEKKSHSKRKHDKSS